MLHVNEEAATPADELALLASSAELLFRNGQTTQSTMTTVRRLASALGRRALLFPRWGEIIIRIDGPAGGSQEIVGATPAGVDMNKVVATMKVIEDLCAGRIHVTAARSSFAAIAAYPPVGFARFVLFAGAGAAALGVIFGTVDWRALMLIAFSAGLGACLRRWLASMSRNLFLQPFCAALLAGGIGALAVLRLPFAAVGFASVVSLIPGVFLFRMAGGLVELISLRENASSHLILSTVTDGMTAFVIFLAMTFGLIAPKMLIESFRERRTGNQ